MQKFWNKTTQQRIHLFVPSLFSTNQSESFNYFVEKLSILIMWPIIGKKVLNNTSTIDKHYTDVINIYCFIVSSVMFDNKEKYNQYKVYNIYEYVKQDIKQGGKIYISNHDMY